MTTQTQTLDPEDEVIFRGFSRRQMSTAFDEARNSPYTQFPVKYDWCEWKSPFITVMLKKVEESEKEFLGRVEVLRAAIAFFDADEAIVTGIREGAVISTRGYQAW